jgi:hypothetical protein
MMLRHAIGERRRDHRANLVADSLGDELGIEVIRPDQAVETVLLCRANGNDNPARRLEIFFDFVPGGECQLRDPISPKRCGTTCRMDLKTRKLEYRGSTVSTHLSAMRWRG